jgi:hypothetical protein
MSVATKSNESVKSRLGLAPALHRVKQYRYKSVNNCSIQRRGLGLLTFDSAVDGIDKPSSFVQNNTLRAFGLFVVINQLANEDRPIRLLDIEEPETALHPMASGALIDAFPQAATLTQVLVTTHGTDLLDRFDPNEGDHLLLATMSEGTTYLTEIDPANRRIIRKHLATAGGLLCIDQLEANSIDLERQNASMLISVANGES